MRYSKVENQNPVTSLSFLKPNQLNTPPVLTEPVPITMPYLQSGLEFACLLSQSSRLACWGNNERGQTAIPIKTKLKHVKNNANYNTKYTKPAYTNAIADTQLISYSLGGAHACAVYNTLLSSGDVLNYRVLTCWGFNQQDQLLVPAQ